VHAAASASGPARAHNEDRWQAVAQAGLFVVADGMGGYKAGEVAAELAVQTACRLILAALAGRVSSADAQASPPQPSEIEAALRLAHDACNTRILEYAAAHPDCLGMGTTLVSCLVRDGRLHVAHVGDSRAYRLRDGQLERLTRDHSVGQELQDAGTLTAAQLRQLPSRGILTRALGVETAVASDCIASDWRETDTLLICTDGVADQLKDERIAVVLLDAAAGGPGAQARAVVAAALQAGGTDDATALVVRQAPGGYAACGSLAGSTASTALTPPAALCEPTASSEPTAQMQQQEEQERARLKRSFALRNQELN
jgi:protein phosphatase